MPLLSVTGDPTLTQADALAFCHNARGQTELAPVTQALMQRYPVAFTTYGRRARQGQLKPGTFWVYGDVRPKLLFMVLKESAVGVPRLRYVQAVMLSFARDHARYAWRHLALAAPGTPEDWPEIQRILATWLAPSALPVIVYERYHPGIRADETPFFA